MFPQPSGSELKKIMQEKEENMRAGGRENWPVKIIELAGRTLEQTLVNRDPFSGNKCNDKKCLPSTVGNNKINCRKTCICYEISCKICLMD